MHQRLLVIWVHGDRLLDPSCGSRHFLAAHPVQRSTSEIRCRVPKIG